MVVFLIALPLCMGVAVASGAPVSAGLITGIIAGLVVGVLSGCPLQVSGPAAGLTVIVWDIIQVHGLERLGLIVLLAGLMQLAAGLCRLGQWFRAVSPAVIQGMLAGIGVLILAGQFHVMFDEKPRGSGLENLRAFPDTVRVAVDHAALPELDLRRKQRVLLQSLGEVHRQQIQLNESIQEQMPDPESRNWRRPADFSAFAARQAEIAEQLEEFLEEAEVEYAANPQRFRRLHARHQGATQAMQASIAALQEGWPPDIPERQQATLSSIDNLMGGLTHHDLAGLIGLATILMLVIWKRFARGALALVPAPLVAVLTAATIACLANLPLQYVEVPDSLLDEVHYPTLAVLSSTHWGPILQAALLLAVVASAETLLSAAAVDQMQDGPRAKFDRELASQGVGNLLCGLVGALPMTGVIVRSGANVQAGATSRLSATLHGLWLLLFVVALGALLRTVPIACLAGVLVFTGFKLVDMKAVRRLREFGWGEVATYLVTLVTIVCVDLLSGVLTGILVASLRLLYTFSQLEVTLNWNPESNRAVLHLGGAATFMRIPQLAAELERIPRGCEMHLDLEDLQYLDHACVELLMTWAKQHEATGGTTEIDWPRLRNTATNGRTSGDASSRSLVA